MTLLKSLTEKNLVLIDVYRFVSADEPTKESTG